MTYKSLTTHDFNVLEKIKDPESAPSMTVLIDSDLPRDPHITDSTEYERLTVSERDIIRKFQKLEARSTSLEADNQYIQCQLLADHDACTSALNNLITSCPEYASARNNYAQALRRKFGESVLLKTSHPLYCLPGADRLEDKDITEAAQTILHNLDTAIVLLSPRTPFAPLSPQAAKTLSQAYTQRGALYHVTARQMHADREACLRLDRVWSADDLEELASRDFMMGGKYGNDIAKALAVAANPTAKLCGSIVREAMKREFGEL